MEGYPCVLFFFRVSCGFPLHATHGVLCLAQHWGGEVACLFRALVEDRVDRAAVVEQADHLVADGPELRDGEIGEVGLERASKRAALDRFEVEQVEFFERVRAAYLTRAEQASERYRIVDAGQPLLSVKSDIKQVLEQLYG